MQLFVLAAGLVALATLLFLLIYKIAAQLRVRKAAKAGNAPPLPVTPEVAAEPAPERRRRIGGAGLVSLDDPSRPEVVEVVVEEPVGTVPLYAGVEAELEDAFALLEAETITLADYTARIEAAKARLADADGCDPAELAAAREAVEWCLDWAGQLASGERAAA